MACELANAHAPYMQLGSVTVGTGAAAGVFERESLLLSENRSPMSTQVRDLSRSPRRGELRSARLPIEPGVAVAGPVAGDTRCCETPRMHDGCQGPWQAVTAPLPGVAQELTRHAANLGMLAVTTVNPARSKHFYLGFQAEHKLGAGAPLAPRARPPAAPLCCLHVAGSVRPLAT